LADRRLVLDEEDGALWPAHDGSVTTTRRPGREEWAASRRGGFSVVAAVPGVAGVVVSATAMAGALARAGVGRAGAAVVVAPVIGDVVAGGGSRRGAGAARVVGVLGLVTRAAQVFARFVRPPAGLGLLAAVVAGLLLDPAVFLPHRLAGDRNRLPDRRAVRRPEARDRPCDGHACHQQDASDDCRDLVHAVPPSLVVVSTDSPPAGSGRAIPGEERGRLRLSLGKTAVAILAARWPSPRKKPPSHAGTSGAPRTGSRRRALTRARSADGRSSRTGCA